MEAIKQQISELQNAWAEAYTAMRANPTAWQPHLPGFFAEQIDEVVSTISLWLGKVDPPDGFKPAFHLAQGLVATSLPQLLTTVKSLQKGEYNYLPSFVNGLNQILSALHSMVVYSSKYDAKHIAADLAAQLAESLSLLGTAQGELKKKADLLNASSDLAKDTEKRATAINDLQQKAAKLLEDTTKSFEKIGSDTKLQTTKILGDANADVIKLTAALEATATKTSADMQAKVTQLNAETEKRAATLVDGLTTKVAYHVLRGHVRHRVAPLAYAFTPADGTGRNVVARARREISNDNATCLGGYDRRRRRFRSIGGLYFIGSGISHRLQAHAQLRCPLIFDGKNQRTSQLGLCFPGG